MEPTQALENLYNAARVAPLTAEQHEILKQSRDVLHSKITDSSEDMM